MKMETQIFGTQRFGIYFLTHATKAPGVRMYQNEQQRDHDFEEAMKTFKIDHGHEILDLIGVQKVQTDGDRFYNHELMKEHWKQEKVGSINT